MNKKVGPSTVSETKTSPKYMSYPPGNRGIDPGFSPLSDIKHASGGKKAVEQGNVSYRKVD